MIVSGEVELTEAAVELMEDSELTEIASERVSFQSEFSTNCSQNVEETGMEVEAMVERSVKTRLDGDSILAEYMGRGSGNLFLPIRPIVVFLYRR